MSPPWFLAHDLLVDPAPARERIDDRRAFFDAGLDPTARADLQAAERSGRLLYVFPLAAWGQVRTCPPRPPDSAHLHFA